MVLWLSALYTYFHAHPYVIITGILSYGQSAFVIFTVMIYGYER